MVLKVEPDQYQSIGQYQPFTGALVSTYMWSDMHKDVFRDYNAKKKKRVVICNL